MLRRIARTSAGMALASQACIALAAFAVFTSTATAAAPGYPDKPIKVISTSPPGGPLDVIARPVMAKLSERLGQAVVLDNRAGANGAIASAFVAKSPPDGYTLLITYLAPVAINPAMRADLPYDSVKDFAPITQLDSAALMLLVRNGLPVKTLPELIAYAKSNPGKLTYGSVGSGSAGHLVGAMLNSRAGIDVTHVPYKGGGPVVNDLLGGHIDMAFIGISGAMSYAEAGRLRGLAVTTLERSGLLPAMPAISEFYPGFDVNSWYGVMAPAGTPKAIVDLLQTEFAAILKLPDIAAVLKANGLEAKGSTPEQFATKIKEELAQWAIAVKQAGLAGK